MSIEDRVQHHMIRHFEMVASFCDDLTGEERGTFEAVIRKLADHANAASKRHTTANGMMTYVGLVSATLEAMQKCCEYLEAAIKQAKKDEARDGMESQPRAGVADPGESGKPERAHRDTIADIRE